MPTRSWSAVALGLVALGGAALAGSTSPSVSRNSHTAVLLQDGTVLVAGGLESGTNSTIPVVEQFVPWSGWQTLPDLSSVGSNAMSSARAVLLPDGRVLYVGQGARYFTNANGWVESTGPFPNPGRENATLTLLRNGQVLLAGGVDYGNDAGIPPTLVGTPGAGASLLWRQPSTGAGSLAQRHRHTATTLFDGGVLLYGGSDPAGSARVPGFLVYDPGNDRLQWLDAGSAEIPNGHTATRLLNGNVLVFGDSAFNTRSAQLIAGNLAAIDLEGRPPNMSTYDGHAAVLLPNGEVELSGGTLSGGVPSAAASRYLPADGGWLAARSLAAPRRFHTATLLMDGKVLVVGGSEPGDIDWELRDPIGFFFKNGPSGTGRPAITADILPNGDLLLVGGEGAMSTDVVLRLSGDTTTATGLPLPGRTGHTTTLLLSRELLVLGGLGSSLLDDCWLIGGGSSNTWKRCRPMPAPRREHTATLLGNGKVLVTGGADGTGTATATAWIFDPAAPNGGSWLDVGPMDVSRFGHAAVLLPNGRVVIAGGWGGGRRVEAYDPASGDWDNLPDLNQARHAHTMTLLRDGRLLVAGGFDGSNVPLTQVELLDANGSSWAALPDDAGTRLGEPRVNHAALALPTGDVVLVGGAPGVGGTTASRFSPLTDTFIPSSTTFSPVRRRAGMVIGNHAEVIVVGGAGTVSAPLQTYSPALHPAVGGSSHALSAAPLELPLGTTSTLVLSGPWLQTSEASSGDGRNSSVNLPHLVMQRLDNGEVLVPPYQVNLADGTITVDLPPLLNQGVWRAWAYVSGFPGQAAWFTVGSYTTTSYLPPSDGGTGDGGLPSDGGLGGPFTLSLAFEGEDPRVTLARVGTQLHLSAPDGTPGSALGLKLKPSPDLEVCEGTSCADAGVPVWLKVPGTVGSSGLDYPRLSVRPLADGQHLLTGELTFQGEEAAWDARGLESVTAELAPGICGRCSSTPGALSVAAAGWVLVRLWRRKRRSP